ncbi:MAG: response regulator transcription factor [Chitinophagaceae bacterium]
MEERKILIIEDEQKIADTIKFGLIENGYYSEVAYDGKIGLQMFTQQRFNLLIIDINLPGINGYELCKAIRFRDAQVPIIILTALTGISNKVDAYNAGVDDYMVKPFEFRELLLKIGVLLKRTMQQHLPVGNFLRAADLVLNLDSKEVHRDGKPIKLTAKEFQLLEFMMRHKNKVVSRADIAVNVWDVDFHSNTNVIDVYISYVRNKIDKHFEQKLLQTQVGMGYMLKDNL